MRAVKAQEAVVTATAAEAAVPKELQTAVVGMVPAAAADTRQPAMCTRR